MNQFQSNLSTKTTKIKISLYETWAVVECINNSPKIKGCLSVLCQLHAPRRGIPPIDLGPVTWQHYLKWEMCSRFDSPSSRSWSMLQSADFARICFIYRPLHSKRSKLCHPRIVALWTCKCFLQKKIYNNPRPNRHSMSVRRLIACFQEALRKEAKVNLNLTGR